MPILNHAKHMALLKRRAKALRSARGGQIGAFFLVVDREQGDVLLHLDLTAEPEVFRNPAIIARRLKRIRAVQPDRYSEFLAQPKRLVSVAGRVAGDTQGMKLVFQRTVKTGKGKPTDLRQALKLFRMLRGTIGEIEGLPEAPEPEQVAEKARERVAATRSLFAERRPTPERALEGLYEHLGSVDALAEAVDALDEALEDNPGDRALSAMREALEQALEQLDAWDAEMGFGGVTDGLEALTEVDLAQAARDLARSAVEEVRAGWAGVWFELDRMRADAAPEVSMEELFGKLDPRVRDGLRVIEDADDPLRAVRRMLDGVRLLDRAVTQRAALSAFDDTHGTALSHHARAGLSDLARPLAALAAQLA